MPNLLQESDIDLASEALDEAMDAAEENQELASFFPSGAVGDLSNGGRVGRATIYPTENHKRVNRGRASARRAWMWDGTETVLSLAWNPEGNKHDGGRHYLRKRHCLCCNSSGFVGECKVCIQKNCSGCNLGRDKTKIIACFYLRKEDVPFPQKFYGPINCFLPFCPRKNGMGFKTEEDMRMHAQSRHRMEYRARQETLAAQKISETDELRRELAELRAAVLQQQSGVAPPKKERTPAQKAWAAQLAARAREKAAAKV